MALAHEPVIYILQHDRFEVLRLENVNINGNEGN